MADRPRYTEAELTQYFDRIGLPPQRRLLSVSALSEGEKLAHLALLVKHQLVRVPFENLAQHYSWHRTVDVSPRHVFRKIVQGPRRGHGSGRGGYCAEANTLLHTALLSLGYDVYMAGARVRDARSGRYGGFSHCVNVVATAAGSRYMVDVGFGANGPTVPVPLRAAAAGGGEEEEEPTAAQIAPASVRLRHEPIPQQTNQDCRVWIYEHRAAPGAEWVPTYCFVDFEFLLEDIRGLNLSPWRSPRSFFTRRILVTRFTTDREAMPPAAEAGAEGGSGGAGGEGPGSPDDEAVAGGEIDGAIILFEDTLKWRRGGETKLEIKFGTDEERVEALRRYFGIVLDEEDRDAIRGTVGEITDAW